eukprot:TRINITY_DN11093_c0_g1_i1.p1 TRINITY_DN11093_c0_g1~~TRINITY_DN11093_c0_g1_i1.p1  ORF type:complete len:177 (+),score=33.56 TRINITY_DN11093_c0_g1_i1:245-775(+)
MGFGHKSSRSSTSATEYSKFDNVDVATSQHQDDSEQRKKLSSIYSGVGLVSIGSVRIDHPTFEFEVNVRNPSNRKHWEKEVLLVRKGYIYFLKEQAVLPPIRSFNLRRTLVRTGEDSGVKTRREHVVTMMSNNKGPYELSFESQAEMDTFMTHCQERQTKAGSRFRPPSAPFVNAA